MFSKKVNPFNNRKYLVFFFFSILMIIAIAIIAQYSSYLDFSKKFSETQIKVNPYRFVQDKDEESYISTGHRDFIIVSNYISNIQFNKYIQVNINPQFAYRIVVVPKSITTSTLTNKDYLDLKNFFDTFSLERNIPKTEQFDYGKILNGYQNNPNEHFLVIRRTGSPLIANTKISIEIKYVRKNLFSFLFGYPSVSADFTTNSDQTDQYDYDKKIIYDYFFDIMSKKIGEIEQYMNIQNCPFRMSDTVQFSQYFKLIDGSQCDPDKKNQIEHPDVEIYTQNLEEGKQKFREMSLAPIGLSEGPRLRVNYIHKPGGYISPTPKK